MLGMLVLGHQSRHTLCCGGADALAPVDQTLRRPFHVGAVRRRHVLAAARKRGYMAQFSGVDKRHPKMADKG
jgi:hypothetical protein